jgi:leader peptidase (prepilin peptidase)/N-methyltransferase
VGSAVFYLFGEIGGILAGTDAMGGGDVKLAGFIGAFLGWQGVLMTVFYSALIGAASGLVLLLTGGGKREGGFTKFAFGPYICMGAGIVLYFGHNRLFDAYLALSHDLGAWLAGQVM